MTIGQIITFALICTAFWLGNRFGYANGYVAGRKAVRKYYEGLMARDQRVNEARDYQAIQAWDNK